MITLSGLIFWKSGNNYLEAGAAKICKDFKLL